MHHRWAATRGVGISFVVLSFLLAGCIRSSPYVADAGPDRTVAVGTVVELEGRVLRIDNGQALPAPPGRWTFVQAPDGSDAQFDDTVAEIARFVPDVAGVYVVRMNLLFGDWALEDEVTVTARSEPVLLPGAPDDPAVSATFDFSFPLDRDPSLVEALPDAADGARVHRGEIEIAFDPAATVGELNELLERFGARIVDMLPDHPQVVVRIPDPGGLAALQALVAEIERDPIVEFVLPGLIVEPPVTEAEELDGLGGLALPGGIDVRLDRIDHQLAIRAHAAWNAREAIVERDRRPWLLVPDFYGAGVPNGRYVDATFRATDFATGAPHSHGYHVLGIVVGAFDASGTAAPGSLEQQNDDVTGVVPATLRVRVVDLREENTLPRTMNRAIARIQGTLFVHPDARIVVNTSLGSRTWVDGYARSWTRKVRGWIDATTVGAGLEHRFLHFTSAGNVDVDDAGNPLPAWSAEQNSPYAYAALGDMSSFVFRDYPNLTNVLVVENRRNTPHVASGPRPQPTCASDMSIMGGTLSAIGSRVYSFGTTVDPDRDVHDVATPEKKSGTSMASPQAAGVAALVWALAPDLSVPQVRDLLLATALDDPGGTGAGCNAAAPQPVVDAYAAVLAAAGDAAWRAILDVDGNLRFDEFDLERFVDAFAGLGATLDYGRLDLNGDGRTGELARDERVDLDGDGAYGPVSVAVRDGLGRDVSRFFDERAVSDADVLCHQAYGGPYAGDPAARDALVGDRCAGGPIVTITSPRDGLVSGFSDQTFRATVESTAAPAEDVGAYTIYWSYRRGSGEVVRLGTTASGESLFAQTVCALTTVTADARRTLPARRGTDRVTFTVTDPRPGPWAAHITAPGVHTFHVDVDALAGGLVLTGEARRMACDGDEVDTGRLRWLDEGRQPLGTDASLTLPATFFDEAASFRERRVTLSHDFGASETSVRLVPCSTRAGSGLFVCPELWPQLREDMVGRHLVLAELLEPDAIRERIETEVDLLLGGGAATPFPLPIPEILGGLDAGASPALRSRLVNLLEATTTADLDEFEAAVRALEASVAQEQDLAAAELAMLSQAIGAATAAAAVYAPAAEGGADGWWFFPFADPAIAAEANPLVPVQSALRGFLTGYLVTRGGGFGEVEPYDVVRSRAAGIEGAALGGLDALASGLE